MITLFTTEKPKVPIELIKTTKIGTRINKYVITACVNCEMFWWPLKLVLCIWDTKAKSRWWLCEHSPRNIYNDSIPAGVCSPHSRGTHNTGCRRSPTRDAIVRAQHAHLIRVLAIQPPRFWGLQQQVMQMTYTNRIFPTIDLPQSRGYFDPFYLSTVRTS